MKLALTIVGIVLATSTTEFGSDSTRRDNRHTGGEPTFNQTTTSAIPARNAAKARTVPADRVRAATARPEEALIKVSLNPVPREAIEADLASLRTPEGPPPPVNVSVDALCHSLASAAKANGIPPGFFARLIWQESKFKQRAVSHAGAQGVAQFMPAVAAERGLSNPFDPLDALPHSARFLKEHLDNFGNLGLAAAAYNGGARRVMDWLGRRGRLPQETRDYVKSITGHEPERWIEENHIELAVNLPSRAPCEGVADLSRDAEPKKVAVQLEPPVAKLIVAARIAASKAKAAAKEKAKARVAKAKRGKLLAKGRGGKAKPSKVAGSAKQPAKIADRAPTDRAAKGGRRLAETSAARR